jgi:S-adenosylmethionine hydrolase
MPRPVVALLTDFGLRDHYVGAMKGVMLGICPDVSLVDISHDVPPHDVLAAALELAAVWPYFPAGTIFLTVVDPGVGSTRRGIAVDAGGYRFIAPDNGVLTPILDAHPPARVVELTEPMYARATISRTFEGRDRFSPAAAWLATGVDVAALGRPAGDIVRIDLPRPSITVDAIAGCIVRIDRFGNLITNIDRRAFDTPAFVSPRIQVGPHQVDAVVSTYSDIAAGGIAALFGSTDHLEIAARGASAADALHLGRGAVVHISRSA